MAAGVAAWENTLMELLSPRFSWKASVLLCPKDVSFIPQAASIGNIQAEFVNWRRKAAVG